MRFLTADEHAALTAAMDLLLPADPPTPGAGEAGGADYVDGLLGAFSTDPPRILAGGPFSGRRGGGASYDRWLELGALEELGWRIRIEGSQGLPEREFNGPVVGWQELYRRGLAELGADFSECDPDEGARRLRSTDREFRHLLFEHACEALYGDPVYGGNRDGAGWLAVGFPGDTQPRGYRDHEVEQGR